MERSASEVQLLARHLPPYVSSWPRLCENVAVAILYP